MSTRDASVDWVRRALIDELREPTASAATRAENFVAIAEHFCVPIETLINWIQTPAPKKQWLASEFRRFCEHLVTARSISA